MSIPYRYVAAVSKVRLTANAENELSHSTYVRTTEWLKQWTPLNNFKAVFGEDLNHCVHRLRAQVQGELVPAWLTICGVKPEHFEFSVVGTDVNEAGEFWSSFSIQVGSFHKAVF